MPSVEAKHDPSNPTPLVKYSTLDDIASHFYSFQHLSLYRFLEVSHHVGAVVVDVVLEARG